MSTGNAPILVPLDGSKNAENAIPAAITMAGALSARLHFLHVVDHHEVRGTLDLGKAQDQFRSYVTERLAGQGLPGGFEAIVRTANPARVILDLARGASCVVIASHGRGGWKAAFVGSVADKIVRGSTVPTLMVPGIGPAPRIDQGPIVIGLDGSQEGEQGLAAARRLASELGASLILVRSYSLLTPPAPEFAYYVPDSLPFYRETATEYLSKIASAGEQSRVIMGDASSSIQEVAQAENARMIVVTSHGKGFASRLALGSTTDRLMHSLRRPLYVVPTTHG